MQFTKKELEVLHSALTIVVEDLDTHVMDAESVTFVDMCKELLDKFN